jgi:hypothetical protein
VTLKGKRRLLSIIAVPVVADDGKVECLLSFARNLSEEAEAEHDRAQLAADRRSIEQRDRELRSS